MYWPHVVFAVCATIFIAVLQLFPPEDYGKPCRGSFQGCCAWHGGIDSEWINDGRGFAACNFGDNYPKVASCKCNSS